MSTTVESLFTDSAGPRTEPTTAARDFRERAFATILVAISSAVVVIRNDDPLVLAVAISAILVALFLPHSVARYAVFAGVTAAQIWGHHDQMLWLAGTAALFA